MADLLSQLRRLLGSNKYPGLCLQTLQPFLDGIIENLLTFSIVHSCGMSTNKHKKGWQKTDWDARSYHLWRPKALSFRPSASFIGSLSREENLWCPYRKNSSVTKFSWWPHIAIINIFSKTSILRIQQKRFPWVGYHDSKNWYISWLEPPSFA